MPVSALKGAHKIFLRGGHQGHGTPIINCNSLGRGDPSNTGCCAFCGKGNGSCVRGSCDPKASVKCECVATDEEGEASLAPIWTYLFTGDERVGSALPIQLQMHCYGGTLSLKIWL